ncbi:hypothetical protein GIB67_016139 [Kingdonia uniflora]|uniref:Uncharacterized protein n=1 Tax=Kingdonia uniflora TaxID=39325 RepID=A0A7J7N978_9MAGN|nr:hypothetical protein GIB67_016139 [Kingdonia uniflora]
MEKSHDKVLLNKIKTYMLRRLVEHGNGYLKTKKGGDSGVKGSVEMEVYGAAALKLGFSVKFFELGSSSDCLQGNRKVIFSLHDDFLKLDKGCSSVQGDITDLHTEMDLHNGMGLLGDDDPIYLSRGEVPISMPDI